LRTATKGPFSTSEYDTNIHLKKKIASNVQLSELAAGVYSSITAGVQR
jgi:hypothetical protein